MKMTTKVRAVAATLITFGSLVGGAHAQSVSYTATLTNNTAFPSSNFNSPTSTSFDPNQFHYFGLGGTVPHSYGPEAWQWNQGQTELTGDFSMRYDFYYNPATPYNITKLEIWGGLQWADYEVTVLGGATLTPNNITFYMNRAGSYDTLGLHHTVSGSGTSTILFDSHDPLEGLAGFGGEILVSGNVTGLIIRHIDNNENPINPSTGQPRESWIDALSALKVHATMAVPEPSGFALVGLGCLGLLLKRMR